RPPDHPGDANDMVGREPGGGPGLIDFPRKKIKYRGMAGTGGARPGAGRKPGTLNKATIERALRAARQVADAKAAGRKLAVEVLDECMHLTMGMAAEFQKQAGGPMPRAEDWDK